MDYTVVGFYERNYKVFRDHVTGNSSEAALAAVTHSRMEGPIIIAAIFEGHHEDIYDIEFRANYGVRGYPED